MSKRYLLVLWEGGGNVPPALTIARKLIARGHTVRVLGDPTIEAEARAAGCEFTSWTTAPHVTERTPDAALIRDWEQKNLFKTFKTYMNSFMAGPAPRWAADVDAELAGFEPDAVLCDMYLPATMIPVEARKIPLAGILANHYILPTKGIPPMGPGFMPAKGPLGRGRDAVMRRMLTRMFGMANDPINATRKDYGLEPVRSVFEQMLTGRTYVLTSPVYDFTSPALPPTVRYAGPQLDDPTWAGSFELPWPADDPRPLVLVAFSSTFQNQIPVLNRVVDALAALPVRAVVTLGQMVEPGAVPGRDNVLVVPSAPHTPLLAEAAALVTHCGHGTLMKGLRAGVPVVCMPMGRDQDDAAARVVYRGAGVRLKPKASSDAISSAVRSVLEDPSYRDRAATLQQAILDGTGCVDIVAELEALVSPRSPAEEHKTVSL